MKKILHITGTLHKHGTQKFIMSILRGIDRSDFQFDFLVESRVKDGYEVEAEALGARIYCIPFSRLGFIKNFAILKSFFKEKAPEYDAIHYHATSFCAIEVLFLAKYCGVKNIIVHSHGSLTDGWHNRVMHSLYKQFIHKVADKWLACSEPAKDWGYKSTKAENGALIVKNPIELADYGFNLDKRKRIREELGLANDFVIGTIGRLSVEKNQAFLIKVLAEIKNIIPDTKLVLVGDGELYENLQRTAAQSGVADSVIFTGFRDDAADIINGFDFLALTSINEGFPFVALEAQANGLPCLFSSAITREVLLSDNSGFESLDNAPSVWAKKITAMKGPRASVKDNYALGEYSVQNTVKTMIEIYSA